MSGEFEIDVRNALVGLLVALGLKWRASDQELIGEDSERPNIHGVVMREACKIERRELRFGEETGC